MLIAIFIVLGFMYGASYFKFMEEYGAVGLYVLSLKWWNIKFNWTKYREESKITLCVKLPTIKQGIRFSEHYIVYDNGTFSYQRFDLLN